VIASERLYPIRRPLAAASAGMVVAILGGLIGLGGAEFRLPILITIVALYLHCDIRINLLHTVDLSDHHIESACWWAASLRHGSGPHSWAAYPRRARSQVCR
jgi:hypothetical protein